MNILLDENVPRPLVAMVKKLLPEHRVDHVAEIGWSGKPDVALLNDASHRYETFITNDSSQYMDPKECQAIKASRLHHVTYKMPKDGLDGLALAAGAITAGVRGLIERLESAPSQRIATIVGIGTGERFRVVDPATNPPSNYWS
ncbi:DUF5615 family PIN-like protein [Demequina gelatinilytica]|uniref:DUF5615 family PIN-like protein n=1 Tax=Demequina gelatinilytica TaxID=1638980 RepID=UPI00078614AD|nr:DUF5615 family PIN-like protein [Demequina gelatinilytica]